MDPGRDGIGSWSMCATCLSTGRRLAPLGVLQRVYIALMECDPRADPSVCWECAALLRRAARFRLRAARAQACLRASRPPGGGEELLDVKPASTLIATEAIVSHIYHAEDHIATEYCSEALLSSSKGEDDAVDSSGFDSVDQDNETIKEENKNERRLLSHLRLENISDGCTQLIRTKEIQSRDKNKPKNASHKHIHIDDTKDIKFTKNESLNTTKIFTELDTTPDEVHDPCKIKKTQKSRNTGKSLKIDELKRGKGRPRSSMLMYKISEDEAISYRKEELERESFRTAKYKCEMCVLILHKSNYTPHMQQAHGEETWKWKCDICGLRCSMKSSLDRHVKEHYELFGCLKCNFKCLSKSRMRYHLERMHNNPKHHRCSTCSKKFTEYIELIQHLKRHKKTDNYYECDKCRKKFKTSLKIINHLKSHELNVCTVCDYSTKRKCKLDHHFRIKHAIAPVLSEVYCVECNKQYYTALSYKSHLATVHSPKPKKVSCPECNKTFCNKNSLKCHNELFHLKNTRFHCGKCNKYFSAKGSLQGHIQQVHDGVQKPKNIMCNICGRGFSRIRTLTHHIRTHTGERPYNCEFCHAAFAQKSAMKIHEKNVHIRTMGNRNNMV